MNNAAIIADAADAPPLVSLSDLEQLWGDLAQSPFADEQTRAHYMANDCPLLLIDEPGWQQPLCA